MKVILNEEVVGLGEPGKLVDVAPGYARNFLIPRKLAVYANTGNVREMEHHQRRLERKRQRMQAAAMSVAERLSTLTLSIQARSGEGGKLFGTVTTTDIAEALKTQQDINVDRRKLHVREPIRNLGEHIVDVHLLGDARAALKVLVFDPAAQAKADAPAAEVPVTEAPTDVTAPVEESAE